jgi:hypothetical protein
MPERAVPLLQSDVGTNGSSATPLPVSRRSRYMIFVGALLTMTLADRTGAQQRNDGSLNDSGGSSPSIDTI